MTRLNKLLAGTAGVAVLAVLAAGGAMVVAQSNTAPSLIDRVAEIAGVDPAKLKNSFKQALKERVDKRLSQGKITEEQAKKMKDRIDKGEFHLENHLHKKRVKNRRKAVNFHRELAEFLGMSPAELERAHRTKSFLQIAKEKGKTETELKNFLLKVLNDKLNKAVQAGKIDPSTADSIRSRITDRMDEIINRVGRPKNFGARSKVE